MRKLAFLLVVVCSATAGAQSAQDKAAATSLFEEGKRLRDAGKLPEACAKFEAAQRLAPTLGRKLNLADCYRRAGRTASAWAEFRESAALAAREKDDDREAFARQSVQDLEKSLSRLTIKLSPGAEVSGLEIRRDGTPLDKAFLDSGVPVDPGSHVVEATAPGRNAWSSKVHVSDGAQVIVEVPVLGEPTHYKESQAPAATPAGASSAPAPAAADTAPSPGRGRRILALVVGGAGVVALGAGVAFGLSAKSKRDDAKDGHCTDKFVCDQAGVDLVNSAKSAATLSTVAVGIGVAAVATGVVLYLTAPSGEPEKSAGLRVTPAVGPDGVAVTLSGGF